MTDSSNPLQVEGENDRWKFRRRAVFIGIGLMSALIVGLIVWGDPENSIQTNAVDDLIWGFIAILGLYIGAPVADDWLQSRKARS